MTPQPGNVKIQVRTISLATPQLTDLGSFAAPAPMMAADLVCVVETGRPVSVASRSDAVAETEAAKPWYLSRRTISMPTTAGSRPCPPPSG